MLTSVLLIGSLMIASSWATTLPAPNDVHVENLVDPIGLTVPTPRFSWRLPDCGRGVSQTSFKIIVTHVETGTVVARIGDHANATFGVDYSGVPLQADNAYNFSLQWWSGERASDVALGSFDMGPMDESAWSNGDWLGSAVQKRFQFQFSVPEGAEIARARFHLDAPGCAVVIVNGKPANDRGGICLWTQWPETQVFMTHSFDGLITAGANAVGIQLGESMYKSRGNAPYPVLRARLFIRLNDGSNITVYSKGVPPPPAPPAPPAPPLLCGTAPEHGSVELACPAGETISAIEFASFGTPTGRCGASPSGSNQNSFAINQSCSSSSSMSAVTRACVGISRCLLQPTCGDDQCSLQSGGISFTDPCHMVHKYLDVAVTCNKSAALITVSSMDSKWLASQGPILSDDPWLGTHTNWSVALADEISGWGTTAFDPTKTLHAWSSATQYSRLNVSTQVRRSSTVPRTVQIGAPLTPTSAVKVGSNSCLVTFAENFAGQVAIANGALTINGAGSISMVHSEKLLDATHVDPAWAWNNNDVHEFSEKYGVFKMDVAPAFTWHGFQFVQINASDTIEVDCTPSSFKGLKMHANVESTGSLHFDGESGVASSSANMLNQLQAIVRNSQLSNVFAGMPTDCPTREKHGWLGDAQVTAEEAMFNFNMANIYTEYLNTIRDSQSSGKGDVPGVVPGRGKNTLKSQNEGFTDISWTAAYPLITAWMYEYYGDTRIINDHWPSLVEYIDGLYEGARGVCPEGLPNYWTWGDWCAVDSRANATPTTGPELASFNYILSVDAMVRMGVATGKDVSKYVSRSKALRPIFHQMYYNASTGTYGPRPLEVQSLTVAPLALENTIPKPLYTKAVAGLMQDIESRNFHLTVGSVGAKHLLPQLAKANQNEAAMKIATQTTYPSFGYWLSKGATTCWENYEGLPDPSHPPTPTHNHIFLCGGLGEWMYRSVGGVKPAAPGYQKVLIFPDPVPSGPTTSTTSMLTASGPLSATWTYAENTTTLNVSISAGMSKATVLFRAPGKTGPPQGFTIIESGIPIWTHETGFVSEAIGVVGVEWSPQHSGIASVELKSGTYTLSAQIKQ